MDTGTVVKDSATGLEKVTIKSENGSTATIFLFGAHVTSWLSNSGKELLFVSKKAIFNGQKAIRGGIPVCFPQFSDMGSLPAHGFARNSTWKLVEATSDSVVLGFQPNEEQLELFPHKYELTLKVSVGDDSLSQEMTVKNTGSDTMKFTTALHTYYKVASIEQTTIQGLKGIVYKDNLDNRIERADMDDVISFSGEVDRIYMDAPNPIMILDIGSGRMIHVEREGFRDAVVWNPWVDKAKSLADFDDDEYKEMVCVEPAAAGTGPVEVAAGETWVGKQELSLYQLMA